MDGRISCRRGRQRPRKRQQRRRRGVLRRFSRWRRGVLGHQCLVVLAVLATAANGVWWCNFFGDPVGRWNVSRGTRGRCGHRLGQLRGLREAVGCPAATAMSARHRGEWGVQQRQQCQRGIGCGIRKQIFGGKERRRLGAAAARSGGTRRVWCLLGRYC